MFLNQLFGLRWERQINYTIDGAAYLSPDVLS